MFLEWESNRNHIELILKFSSCRLTHTKCKPRGYCGAENKNQTPLIQLSFAQISATNVSVAEREQFERICWSPFRCCCLCHFIKPHAQYTLYQPMHGKPGSKVWRSISVAFGKPHKRSNQAEKPILAQNMRQKFESLSMKHLPLLESSSVVKSTAPMEETAARIKLPMITFFLPNLKHKWNTETIIKHFMAWSFLDYRKPFVSFASALSRCCFTTVFIYSFFHQLICWFILSFILILSFIHFFIHLSISSFM